MAANEQHIKNYQSAYERLKSIVQSSSFYQDHIARRHIGGIRNLIGSLVKSARLREFVEGLRNARTPNSFIPGLDKALTLIHETVDRIRNSAPHSAYSFKLMSDLPLNGELRPFTIYIAKEGNMLRYIVAHPNRTGAGRIEGQIRVEPSLHLPDPLTLDALTADIQEEILQITFERGDTVNDDKHLQRLIDILDCVSDDDKECADLLPILGYNSHGKAYDSIPRRVEPVAVVAEKEPEVLEENLHEMNPVPARLSQVALDGAAGSAEEGTIEGERALASLPPYLNGPGILVELVTALTRLGSNKDLRERNFQNFKLLTPVLKQFLLNVFAQVRHGNIPADTKDNIRLLLEEVHALLLVAPQEGTISDLNLPSLELSAENIIQVRKWLENPYTVVAPEGEEGVAEEGSAEDGGRFIIPPQDILDVNPLHGGIAQRDGGDPLFRVTDGTNDAALVIPEVRDPVPPVVATPPHSIASTTHIAGASSLWHGAKRMHGYLRSRRDAYQHVSLPMMRLFATLRKFENDPVLAAATVSGKTVWESLNPTEAGKFRVRSLVGTQANPQEGILDSAIEQHSRYQQQYTTPLSQIGGIYQPPGKRYHFKRTRSDLIQLIDIESLTAEELREATHELIVICQDVFDKIDIDICVYDNDVFEQPRGEELLKQVVMTTMSQGVNLLAADKAEEQDKAIQQQACELKSKMDAPQPEFQDLETQPQRFIQADTTRWVAPKETLLREEGIRVMTESGRVLPKIDFTAPDEETELRCEYWSTIGNWEKENDWRSIASATDIFLHVLEPLQTAPELYQKDGIYGHLTLLGESELKTFEECVEQQRQELEKWATVRQETLRRQSVRESQSVYRGNDEFAESDDDALRDSAEQQQSRQYPDNDTESRRRQAADFAQQQQSMRHVEAEDFSDAEEPAPSELDEEDNGSDDDDGDELAPIFHQEQAAQYPVRPLPVGGQSQKQAKHPEKGDLIHRSLPCRDPSAPLPVSPLDDKAEFRGRSRNAKYFQDGRTSVTLRASTTVHTVATGHVINPPAVDESYDSDGDDEENAAAESRPLLGSTSSQKSSINMEEEAQFQMALGEVGSMEKGIQEAIESASKLPPAGPREIPGFDIGDANDNGNCFYYSLVTQFEILDQHRLDAVPRGEKAHKFLRKKVEGDDYENKRFVDLNEDFQSISEKFNIVIAIIDTRSPQDGFRCYYSERGQLRDACVPSQMPKDNRLIVRLAFSGNHFMPVLGHPLLTDGALRAAYGSCATPHRVDSLRDRGKVTFFGSDKTPGISAGSAKTSGIPTSSAKTSGISVSLLPSANTKPVGSPTVGESRASTSGYTHHT